MILLQAGDTTGFFDAMAQQGIAFGLMAIIIVVLVRRIMKLEDKIEQMTEDKFKYIEESTLLIQQATEAMANSNQNKCRYEEK